MTATNRFAQLLLAAWLTGKTIHCMLLSGNTQAWQTVANVRDFNFAEDLAGDEPTGWTNYARVALTGGTVSEDDANDRAEIDFNDITFAALDSSSETVDGVAFIQVENDDTDSPILGVIDVTGELTADRTPDGNNFIINIGAEGLIHLPTA